MADHMLEVQDSWRGPEMKVRLDQIAEDLHLNRVGVAGRLRIAYVVDLTDEIELVLLHGGEIRWHPKRKPVDPTVGPLDEYRGQ